METIKYTSPNGYSGVLYGESSLAIYRPDGTESLHTGRRSINTYEELVRLVDEHPEFERILANIDLDDLKDEGTDI